MVDKQKYKKNKILKTKVVYQPFFVDQVEIERRIASAFDTLFENTLKNYQLKK